MIKELVMHVKMVANEGGINKGIAHFNTNAKKFTKDFFTHKNLVCTSHGLFFGKKGGLQVSQKTNLANENSIDLLKDKLFLNSKEMFDTYQGLKSIRGNFCKEMVQVKVDDQNTISGTVVCIFCGEDKKSANVKVYGRKTETSLGWVLSNLKTHVNKHHVLNPQKKDVVPEVKKVTMATNKNTSDTLALNTVCSDTKDASEIVLSCNDNINTPKTLALCIEPCSAEKRNLDDEIDNFVNLVHVQLMTQNIKMQNTAILNKENTSKLILENKISVEICETKSDGNCLFSALAHQLFYCKINDADHQLRTKELRQHVVQHINKNFLRYENELKGRIHEIKKGVKIDNMENDCLNFVNHCLVKPNCWGGSESLKAISEIQQVNIIIIHQNGSINLASSFNPIHVQCVIILFRNNNHYESIVNISKENITNFVEILAKNNQKHQKFLRDAENSAILIE